MLPPERSARLRVRRPAVLGLGLVLAACARPSADAPPCTAGPVDVSAWDVADAEVVAATIRLPPGHGPAMQGEYAAARATAWSVGGLVVVVGLSLLPDDPGGFGLGVADDSVAVCSMGLGGVTGVVSAYSASDVGGPSEFLEGAWKLPDGEVVVRIVGPAGSSRDTMQAIMASLKGRLAGT